MSGAAGVTEVTIRVCAGGVRNERTFLDADPNVKHKAALAFLVQALVEGGADQRKLALQLMYLGAEMMPKTKPKPKPVLNEDGTLKNFMFKEAGRSFRCACGGNVFHQPDDARLAMYRCNSCEQDYGSE
jgi:hypothetical protein